MKNNLQPNYYFKDIKTLVFYLTDICNLSCSHCLFKCNSTKKKYLDKEWIFNSIDQLKSIDHWKNIEIGFSGGEIFLHPELNNIINYIQSIGFKVGLVTNGTLIDEKKLNCLEDEGLRIAVSLDGLKNDNDRIRGDGVFEKIIKNLDILNRNNIVFNIHTAVTPKSLKNLDNFVDFLLNRYFNISIINIQNILPFGRAKNNDNLILSDNEKSELFYKCQELKTIYLQTTFHHFLHQRDFVIRHPCRLFACSGKNCHSNSSDIPPLFNILWDGKVIPLWSLLNPYFCIGDIKQSTIIDLLNIYVKSPKHHSLKKLIKTVYNSKIAKGQPSAIFDWASIIIKESYLYV